MTGYETHLSATFPETSDASTRREMRSRDRRGAFVGSSWRATSMMNDRTEQQPNSNEVMSSGKWLSSCINCSWMTACRQPAAIMMSGASMANESCALLACARSAETGAAASGASGGSDFDGIKRHSDCSFFARVVGGDMCVVRSEGTAGVGARRGSVQEKVARSRGGAIWLDARSKDGLGLSGGNKIRRLVAIVSKPVGNLWFTTPCKKSHCPCETPGDETPGGCRSQRLPPDSGGKEAVGWQHTPCR